MIEENLGQRSLWQYPLGHAPCIVHNHSTCENRKLEDLRTWLSWSPTNDVFKSCLLRNFENETFYLQEVSPRKLSVQIRSPDSDINFYLSRKPLASTSRRGPFLWPQTTDRDNGGDNPLTHTEGLFYTFKTHELYKES